MKYMKMFLVFPILLLVIVAGGFYVTQPLNSLTMDVNPSIEIVTNRLDRVVRINPLNKDAENLLKNFNPKDKRLEKTITDLVDLMILTGYIHDEKDNFLMITVHDSVDSKLIDKVNSAIASILKNKHLDATLLNQSIPTTEKADDLTGVQLAALRILEMNKSVDPNIFTSMTIEDLIQYSNANNLPIESLFVFVANEIDSEVLSTNTETTTAMTQSTTATVSTTESATVLTTNSRLSAAEALQASTAVLDSSNRLSAAEARQAVLNKFGGIIEKIEYTYEENNPHYKGEALIDGSKVVFELNARTKEFTKWDIGNDNGWDSFSEALPNMITMNQAANSVIGNSGVSNTFVQKIDFKWDDSEPLYQGEAFNKGVKYSFEIYAYSGNFKKWDSSSGDETWSKQYFNVR